MKITKFVHSCLLVETSEINVLFDPGNFTWDSHLLNINELPSLNSIVITHEHPDHYHEQGLKKLSHRFPRATIITNNDLAEKISKLKLPNPIQGGSDENVVVFEAVHEPLPLNVPNVLNIGVHIQDKLTHPGDSFAFKHTCEVLALPLTGPWASLRDALKTVVELKPKTVIPVHDWEWHKAAREARYSMCKNLLEPHSIEFIGLENAQPIEI
ncbi:MAG TPA: MBL fold metallo-hydrolase [Candidatus Saccharimonadales bacterium]|nr:MBL fold metallo-hydrolase [Candidatus Saccharimonadales bacterium]HSX27501.1 MBL fold metallo-hydrolase [Patescibacteria group bacterium]